MKLLSISTWLVTLLPALLSFLAPERDDPFTFYLYSNRIYSPDDNDISVYFNGQGRDRVPLQIRAYRVLDPVEFFLAQPNPHSPGLPDTATQGATHIDTKDSRQFKLVKEWDQSVRSRDRYWYNEQISIPFKEKGVYVIEAYAKGKAATTVLVITELGMIVKQSKSEALAFVMNRKTGEKAADVPVAFAHGRNNAIRLRTGSDGVAQAEIGSLLKEQKENPVVQEDWGGGYNNQILAVGAKDGNFVISDSYFYRYYGNGNNASFMMYLHTDRPVYRPAQVVNYRGIIRHIKDDGTYENVNDEKVSIDVTDARGGAVKKDTLTLSDMGTFSGNLTLGDEPPLGTYNIKVTVKGEERAFTFDVEEYKKPEYEVTVTADKGQYTRGDEIKASIKADYYFGSPVAEGEVQYSVYRSPFWRPWWYGSRWGYLYEMGDSYSRYNRGNMEMVHNGSGKLKSDGTFSFSYKTDASGDNDYIYTVQANVVDASRRSISGSTTVKVTRGEFYITSQSDKYLYKPNEKALINVQIRSFDEKPVSNAFDVKVQRNWWDSRRSHNETVWSGSGKTNNDGVGSVEFTPKETGYYTFTVEAKDSRGTPIATSSSIYVADQNYSYWYQEGGVQIIPDKALYKPGETMSALVILPKAGMDALVTLEGSTIYEHRVERLSSTSAIVRFPIEERYAPMVYLSVASINDNQMQTNSAPITVAPETKIIKLEIEPSKQIYKPGESGTVTVRAVDSRGEPVGNVNIALAMVDEAVYAIRPDATQAIEQAFYGSRQNEVQTNTSLYFSFYNQAVAQAAPMAADASGESSNRLAGGFSKMALRDGRADEKAVAFLQISQPAYVEPTIRTDFKDLMFWTPSVRTRSDGTARIEVKFPDNLTTWRMTARGVTRATQVGQATASVIARKDLLVRMETPRFITQGDEMVIATTVHNYLGSRKITKVQFSGENVSLKDHEQVVTIGANGEERIDWKITAPKIGEAKFTVKALTDEESDAMELTVPILPRGVRSATAAIADLDGNNGSRTLSMIIPDNADPATGELLINLSTSAASSILSALDELIGYPYGCVEQTMSRFLPTVVVADALKQINVPFNQAKRDEMPKMVNQGLMRLYNFQHSDGGWGWWEHDQTNPFMTAYVMYGMTVAKRAGYEIPAERYANGLRSLLQQIEARKAGGGLSSGDESLNATTEAYMLYVATMIGGGDDDKMVEKHITALAKRDDINNYGKALLALAANQMHDSKTASMLASKLKSAANITETSAHWKGASWHYNWQDDQVETSAFVIKALMKIEGESELVNKGIRWLLTQKTGDAWENTRQTAMVIYTVVDYVQSSKELNPEYTVTVKVNGRQVYTKALSRKDVFSPEQQIRIDASSLRAGENQVTIEKNGTGKLYATARLVYYATGPAIKPASAGFTVEREYYTLRRELKNKVYVYTKQPFNGTVKSGDELFVKVKIKPDSRYEYFMLEDPLPAGCEVITETSGYTIPGESEYNGNDNSNGGYGRGQIYRPWNRWYADRDVRDEKVAFFAQKIEAQQYEFSYIMRAQIPGKYSVMPSVGALMYYPEVRGNSAAIAMTITE